ncbi:neurogenic locus Notch protein [Lingula anatina]|uniref:Neurogenic locus Notch protein n=1 Tax=Lingula anatina TaxID=7574 RepID=A0A1S3I0R6_LINAN|nr:neurogenic locus Notch protein [Lingula anatina]|eukprot:XP_013391853.1 neurogenic locus Notch protein [Lingula anatina]
MWSLLLYLLAMTVFLLPRPGTGSHFRFGTISCAPSPGNALQARCSWRSAWRLTDGPCRNPCTEEDVGQLTTGLLGFWQCFLGCGFAQIIAPHRYYLTAIDRDDFWQQGYNDFTFNLPNAGVFAFGYVGCCWVTLVYGGGSWAVYTEYNAGIRSDTGTPNSSPITTSKPLIDMDILCGYRFKIPYADADGDTVRCRWGTGFECGGICSRLPGATLYPNCTLVIPASARPLYGNGLYGVAIMLEDFPTSSITQGGVPKDGSTPLSKVPLQYLARVKDGCDCNSRPSFTNLPVSEFIGPEQLYAINISATSPNGISTIKVIPPVGANVGPIVPIDGTTSYVNLTWTPTTAQLGAVQLCYEATDSNGCPGPFQCDTLQVVDDPCLLDSPCLNNGTCSSMDGQFTCICTPSFTGTLCETPTCRTNADCNPSATDCLGVTGITSDIASGVLTPIASVMCSFNGRNTLDVTVVYYCNAGACAAYNTSNTLFSECTVGNAYKNLSTETLCSVADTVSPICTFNPFFLFFTSSGYRCMCPLGTYPFIFPFSYVSRASTAVSACFPISGSLCTTNDDCNVRATDCLGIPTRPSLGSPPEFLGGISPDIASFLTSITNVICSFNDRYTVDVTPVYYCNAGSCVEYDTSPLENAPVVNGSILFYEGLVRDFFPSLFSTYPNVVPDPSTGNRLTYLAQNIYTTVFRKLFPP